MPRVAKRGRKEIDEVGDQLADVAGRFEKWRPASEVLTNVVARKTIFPQINLATRVGGWPTQRITLVHGPSGDGKTFMALGLIASYLAAGDFAFLVDSEFTTPIEWAEKLMARWARKPQFLAQRPRTYDETIEAVDEVPKVFATAKAEGKLPESAAGIVVIDSIGKLVPEALRKKIEGGDGGVDGADGRSGMIQAAMNTRWLKTLVPLAYHANLTIVIIAREMERAKANPFDEDFKIGGGKSLVYDSSLQVRVTRASWVYEGSGDKKKIVGERHRVDIRKTKVAAHEGRVATCYFHTSNGEGEAPEGFDRARDLVDAGVRAGVIEQKGNGYVINGQRHTGEARLVRAVRESAELAELIEQRLETGEVG